MNLRKVYKFTQETFARRSSFDRLTLSIIFVKRFHMYCFFKFGNPFSELKYAH